MNGITLLRCICDDTRFGILELLEKEGEMCVNDIALAMNRDQPLISHHLRTLKICGILKSTPSGKKTMYQISNTKLQGLIASVVHASKEIPVLCDSKDCC